MGVSNGTVASWIKNGYLIRVLPKVYAVGHTAPSREADLWAAVLYAGPGAMLSHGSAGHHRTLIIYAPGMIHVSTPRVNIKSIPGVIHVHAGRELERATHLGIPTTTNPQTVLDLAASEDFKVVRRALAVLDYRKQLDLQALDAICGKGRRGATVLKRALERHRPELAYTNGELEEAFLYLCEEFNFPVPKFNVGLHGEKVDAYWAELHLVVEVDGLDNHRSPAQIRDDRRKDLKLRGLGFTVLRYDWDQVKLAPGDVHADLIRATGGYDGR